MAVSVGRKKLGSQGLEALQGIPREKVQIGTKFGHSVQEPDGVRRVRGEPEFVRKACEASLKRLGIDYIDLYYQHRVDHPHRSNGELKKLVEEGKIKYYGLSEASADTIRRAHPVSAIHLEWSLWEREVEDEIIPVFRKGYSGGTGRERSQPGENLEQNKVLYKRVAALAAKHGCTPGQLALAWVSSQGEDVAPIPGTTKIANLDENIESVRVELGLKELEEVSAAVPRDEVAG